MILPQQKGEKYVAESLHGRFETLRDNWKSRTRHLSNIVQIAVDASYQQIIGIGPEAVPLMLCELEKETDHWFWALEAITGVNPVPQDMAGDMQASAQAWLEWGRRNGKINT